MELTHRFSFPAPIEEVWSVFSRLDQIAPCFPGAVVDSVTDDGYEGFVKIKFGPVPLIYRGTAHFAETDEGARRMVVEARAADARRNSDAAATVTANFSSLGAATNIEVLTDLAITGRPAQFGKGVIGDVSDKLLDQFIERATQRFADGTFERAAAEEPRTEAETEAAESLSDSDPAADVAAAGESTGSAAAGYHYRPPTNQSAPDFDAFATVVPVLVKRGWPVLLGGAVLALVIRAILRRRG